MHENGSSKYLTIYWLSNTRHFFDVDNLNQLELTSYCPFLHLPITQMHRIYGGYDGLH